jgi:glycosyltransferase involved in cell wall biosynthesis
MKLQYSRVSVVVRTFNEASLIQQVLMQIRNQRSVEVEIILVDNKSNDKTVALADPFVDRILSIGEFRPGAALNLGIKSAQYENIAIISGHCIPIGQAWLSKLIAPLADSRIAGVYGRQIPTSKSSAYDKRDLWTTFGIESRLQTKDPFFHNANSALTKLTWNEFPFDDSVTNVEDRIWAKQLLQHGRLLKYEADAVVDHWHGINHGGDLRRAENVVRVLDEFGIYNETQ